jgi:hypothetical protein
MVREVGDKERDRDGECTLTTSKTIEEVTRVFLSRTEGTNTIKGLLLGHVGVEQPQPAAVHDEVLEGRVAALATLEEDRDPFLVHIDETVMHTQCLSTRSGRPMSERKGRRERESLLTCYH